MPDRRHLTSATPQDVPRLVREGADTYNRGEYWEAHEEWEEAWHVLHLEGRLEEAEFLQGMILVTAAFENRRRGKSRGFKRQLANALHRMRAHRAAAEKLGVRNADAWLDALVDVHLDCARNLDWDAWCAKDVPAPPVDVSP